MRVGVGGSVSDALKSGEGDRARCSGVLSNKGKKANLGFGLGACAGAGGRWDRFLGWSRASRPPRGGVAGKGHWWLLGPKDAHPGAIGALVRLGDGDVGGNEGDEGVDSGRRGRRPIGTFDR